MDDKLVSINDWLQTRTFLTGSAITLADLVLYAAVQPAVVSGCMQHTEGDCTTRGVPCMTNLERGGSGGQCGAGGTSQLAA